MIFLKKNELSLGIMIISDYMELTLKKKLEDEKFIVNFEAQTFGHKVSKYHALQPNNKPHVNSII